MSDEAGAKTETGVAHSAPRLVLDTNVCLDLLLFADPRCAVLRSSLHASTVHAVTNGPCREEWLRVLRYPQLRLDDERRIALCASFDALTHRVEGSVPQECLKGLPRCSDPDDQKFMELAATSGARWLLSRDRDLLVLGRRTASAGLFQIVAPQDWSGVPSERLRPSAQGNAPVATAARGLASPAKSLL